MTKNERDGILKAAHAAFKELPEEDPGWGWWGGTGVWWLGFG